MKTPLPRKIFFYTLVCSFFITTSLILSSVFGYKFDFVRNVLVHRGSLTVKSNPREVQIKINDKEPSSLPDFVNKSHQINGLRPGNYELEVTAEEFKPWTKNISVHSGVSTELWNVLLIRKNYERTSFNVQDINNFFPAPEEFIFAYVSQKDSNLEIGVINTEDNEIENQFVLPNAKFTDNENENIEWSPTSSSIIVPVIRQVKNNDEAEIAEIKDYAIFDLKTDNYFYLSEKIFSTNEENVKTNVALETNAYTPELNDVKISSVRWHPKDKEAIYYLSDNELNLAFFDLKDQTLDETEKIYSNVLAYDFADDGIYIVDKEKKLLYNNNFETDKLKEITQYQTSGLDYRLIAYDKNRIVLLNNRNGDCFIYNKGDKDIYSKKLATGIIGVHFSNDGKKLAYYSNSEIFVYYTRDWDDQPKRVENETNSITRFSSKIENVHFAKDYEHVIFSSGNEIKIIEIDIRGKSNVQTITPLKTDKTKIISDHRNDMLFFIDKNDYDRTTLYQIDFPEEEPLF